METNDLTFTILTGLAIVHIILMAIFNGVSLVFAILYAFFWDKLRGWFNKKAGVDFMQTNRLGDEQMLMMKVGIGIGVIVAIFNIISLDKWVEVLEFLSTVGVLVWSLRRYPEESARLGENGGLWSVTFNLLANLTIISFAVFLSYIAIFIYVVSLLFGGLSSTSFSSFLSSPNSSEPKIGIRGRSEDGDELVLEDLGNNRFRDERGEDYGKNLDGSFYKKIR